MVSMFNHYLTERAGQSVMPFVSKMLTWPLNVPADLVLWLGQCMRLPNVLCPIDRRFSTVVEIEFLIGRQNHCLLLII